MSHITRKPVFGVCHQVWLKPACSATGASWSLEISDIATTGVILSKQRTIMVLIRLCECADWSAPLLFAYGIRLVFSQHGYHYASPLIMDILRNILRKGYTCILAMSPGCKGSNSVMHILKLTCLLRKETLTSCVKWSFNCACTANQISGPLPVRTGSLHCE